MPSELPAGKDQLFLLPGCSQLMLMSVASPCPPHRRGSATGLALTDRLLATCGRWRCDECPDAVGPPSWDLGTQSQTAGYKDTHDIHVQEVPASRVSTPHQGARNVSEASWECQAASYAGRDDGARCLRSVCGGCLHRVCWCLSLIGM